MLRRRPTLSRRSSQGARGACVIVDLVYPIAAALAGAVLHFGLLLLIQIENYLAYARPPGTGVASTLGFLLRLPLVQGENLLAALLLGSVLALPRPGRSDRARAALGVAVLSAANVYVTLDQVAYRLFFDHFMPSWSEGDVGKAHFFLDSFKAELGPLFFLNLALCALCAVALQRALRPAPLEHLSARLQRSRRSLLFGLALYLPLSFGLMHVTDNHNLDRHPLATLLRDLVRPRHRAPAVEALDRDVYRPRFGSFKERPEERERLRALRQEMRARHRRPNVVFIVLESVGALQLLPGGRFAPELTPSLARLSEHALLFDMVYAPIPATSRAHVPMNTGGYTITWGGVYDELRYAYRGPTLAGQMDRLGYRTGLFSATDMSAENLAGFYQSIGHYEKVFDFEKAPVDFRERHRISSWGGAEGPVAEQALAWIDGLPKKEGGAPFFLHFIGVSTHHPYQVPAEHRGPRPGATEKERYENALHYNDAVVGRLVEELRRRGLLDNTLVVVTGDHGETFGERHPKNIGHRNYIYEENVRSFLLIIDPLRPPPAGPLRDSRIGRIGASADILPTLLGLLLPDGAAPPGDELLGQDLLSPDYRLRIAFFHKITHPEQWGLRDGQWKYIGRRDEEGGAELYDLDADPAEQRDLSGRFPDRVRVYQDLCASWFAGMNVEYTRRLEGWQHKLQVRMQDLRGAAITNMVFGYYVKGGAFAERERFNPYDTVFAYGQRLRNLPDQTYQYLWTSPSGKRHVVRKLVRLDERLPRVFFGEGEALPMEAGRWTVALMDDGGKVLATGVFVVDPAVPLQTEVARPVRLPQLLSLAAGTREGPRDRFAASERPLLRAAFRKKPFTYRLWCILDGPAGRETRTEVRGGGGPDLFDCAPPGSLKTGHWQARLTTWEGAALGETTFTVE